MNILWIPQISNLSKDGKVLLTKDSNMSVIRNLLGTDFTKNNNITIAFEFESKNVIFDYESFHGHIKNIVFDNKRSFTNAKLERFHFDINYFQSIKDNFDKFDIVFTNEPTKVIPLKLIFPDSKLVTYNHWLAFKNMKDISLRQIEGMMAADKCFVNSSYVIFEILNHYKDINGIENIELVKAEPSFSHKIIEKKFTKDHNIIYNHRLSLDRYYDKAFQCLLTICDKLEESIPVDKMPTIYFTNPSGKNTEVESLKPYFKVVDLVKDEDYHNFLSSSNVDIHLNTFFESEGMWSMSTIDSACCGNMCFLPRKFGYKEMLHRDYFGYCDTVDQMVDKLKWVLSDSENNFYMSEKEKEYLLSHSAERMGLKFNQILGSMFASIEGGVVKKPWGSYKYLYKSKDFAAKELIVLPGAQLSLQKHMFRSEQWMIKGSKAEVNIDGKIEKITSLTTVEIPVGCIHSIKNTSETEALSIFEVSFGEIVSECDIERLGDIYGRV